MASNIPNVAYAKETKMIVNKQERLCLVIKKIYTKISAVYLEKQLRYSRFLHTISYGHGQIDSKIILFYFSFAIKKNKDYNNHKISYIV